MGCDCTNPQQTVNGQISDAVSAANVKVLGDAPAQALGATYQSLGHTTSLGLGNNVNSQQQSNVVHHATTTLGTTLLYTVCTAQTGNTANKVAGGE